MTDSSEAALRAEIARLTGNEIVISKAYLHLTKTQGAINQRKYASQVSRPPSSSFRFNGNNKYINPNYKVTPKSQRPPVVTKEKSQVANLPSTSTSRPHEVVIDGVAFQSSRRSLVRKDSAWFRF